MTLDCAAMVDLPVQVFIDNESCIKLTKGQTFFARSKHINLRYLHARDIGAAGIAEYKKVSTKLNPADPLSKGVVQSDSNSYYRIRDFICYIDDGAFAKDKKMQRKRN